MLLSGEITKGGNITPLLPISIYTHQANLRISKLKGMARSSPHPPRRGQTLQRCFGESTAVYNDLHALCVSKAVRYIILDMKRQEAPIKPR
jgi:hypothetical protein